ncbi:hypothetical protein Emag_006955 [Eimeria magna]
MGSFVEGEKGLYAVEDIIRIRKEFGRFFYLVKWKGYDSSQNTWEPIQSFEVSSNFEFKSRIEELKRCYWDSGQADKDREERLRQRQQNLQQQRQRKLQQQQARRGSNRKQKKQQQKKQQQQQQQQQQKRQQRGKGIGRQREDQDEVIVLDEPSSSKRGRSTRLACPQPPTVSILSRKKGPAEEPAPASLAASERDGCWKENEGAPKSSCGLQGPTEDRCSRLTSSTETVSSRMSAYSSEFSLSSSSSPSCESDSSYSEGERGSGSRRERVRRQRNRQSPLDRRAGTLLFKKPRQGFPPPASLSPPEGYVSKEVEQLDLLRLRERQQQTGGKVSSLALVALQPSPTSPSLSERHRKRKARGHEQTQRRQQREPMQQQQQQQQQQHEELTAAAAAAAESRRKQRGPQVLRRSRDEGGHCLRGFKKQLLNGSSSSGSSSSSRTSSRSSSSSSRSRSSSREASERMRSCSSPLQSWLEGEEEAPELLPAELGSKENSYLEFTGDWDPVARANFRCMQLRKLREQVQQLQQPNRQHQEQQRLLKEVGQWTGALIPAVLARQQHERVSLSQCSSERGPGGPQGAHRADNEYEVVGLEMGEAEETAGEVKHLCTDRCYCRLC